MEKEIISISVRIILCESRRQHRCGIWKKKVIYTKVMYIIIDIIHKFVYDVIKEEHNESKSTNS